MKYKYRLIRTSRRTISVSLDYNNQIIVRAPLRTPLSRIEGFLNEQSGWIEKHLSKNEALSSLNYDIINYKKIYVSGNALPFSMGGQNIISENYVSVRTITDLKSLYVKSLGKEFLTLLNNVSVATSLKYATVNFKDYKSRWGCCDAKNNLIFNYKLLMLPKELQEYVILHELCHTVHHNHSKSFWAFVASFMPDYKTRTAKMKTFGFVTQIY